MYKHAAQSSGVRSRRAWPRAISSASAHRSVSRRGKRGMSGMPAADDCRSEAHAHTLVRASSLQLCIAIRTLYAEHSVSFAMRLDRVCTHACGDHRSMSQRWTLCADGGFQRLSGHPAGATSVERSCSRGRTGLYCTYLGCRAEVCGTGRGRPTGRYIQRYRSPFNYS